MTPASYALVAALCASGRHVTGRARRFAGGFERRRGPGSPKSLTASRGAAPSCLWGEGGAQGPEGVNKAPARYGPAADWNGFPPISAPSLLKGRHGVEGARSTPILQSGGAARRRSNHSRVAGERRAVLNGVKAPGGPKPSRNARVSTPFGHLCTLRAGGCQAKPAAAAQARKEDFRPPDKCF